ncbi:tRNA (adenosine(37)-N6)-threonylcarbamoyltransferase complex transferase subunit TsaD [Haematobacter massiliensis]|uniref:tRNA N6-adenosine threonylcarbamoyltransferase n=1 Tax=Haematobacter massiliensis TaxID=195105 RepID=A0A086Y8G1_9RHOB|nr:tRNA (adenosine(37)-N6)-threonylcarbamoyltransferase complex transferase subunit TsaD [Haematobacter massiliensis]KFI30561.1 protein kinase [Haematobacter massiliensis]OWJ71451.1 tRNA (adenosine(37)-N6)-threonylcarbamoyltransferase complex transferase subunit TsaD [Haematobacter massiliensis]OWJ87262.1 tRNA (adenosine(37)-N6)-threonylcarbamoyltransferase complex transferase subunit TsaD [Haematobacter massiliensis]QBJ25032.1 tRNA (adenosine(37)-N6)-threonylcarbamoyltransferase complex transf
MEKALTLLGIESSCDDTAAAVVRLTPEGRAEVLANVVAGQTALHEAYGGVVPEIAARAHVEKLDISVAEALRTAGLALDDLDGVAVTSGPGLIGGVLAGVMLARGLAAGTGLPLHGINHLAGHALTPRLTGDIAFPYLLLLVSGGHCQFLIVHGPDRFDRLGGTIDDAPGEAFDKVAKLLALPQPGGPAVEAEARHGDAARFPLPRPLLDRPGCDMSFSGLKTAVLRTRDQLMAAHGGLRRGDRADLCAVFQRAVADVLTEKARRAIASYLELAPETPAIAVAGGVAANGEIRAALQGVAHAQGLAFVAPPLKLCTDNAAMIAWAAIERLRAGIPDDPADLTARPRWPLDQSRPALIGSGKKGAKA